MSKNSNINIRIPAEWELQRTIFMAPGNPKADNGESNDDFKTQYKRISKEISRFGAVTFLDSKKELKEFIHDDGYTYFPNKHFDIWARDAVFIPLVSSEGVSALAPRYTSYGHHPLASTDPEAADDKRLAKGVGEQGLPDASKESPGSYRELGRNPLRLISALPEDYPALKNLRVREIFLKAPEGSNASNFMQPSDKLAIEIARINMINPVPQGLIDYVVAGRHLKVKVDKKRSTKATTGAHTPYPTRSTMEPAWEFRQDRFLLH